MDPVEVYSSELGSVDEDKVLGEGFREARSLGSRVVDIKEASGIKENF